MTTRAEEIAAKEYPDSPDREKWPHDERAYVDGMNAALRAAVVKGYKQGQQAARSLAQPPSGEVEASVVVHSEKQPIRRSCRKGINFASDPRGKGSGFGELFSKGFQR